VLDEIRYTRNEQVSGFNRFESSVKQVSDTLSKVVETTNKQNELLKTLAYKSIDLEARSRRNNLIFHGFYEHQGENCFQTVRGLLRDRLDLDPGVYIARAHRLGPRDPKAIRPRPIIANFRDYCDVEEIMSKVYMLKNTPYSVDVDLPKEIQVARKDLWSKLSQCKKNNPRVSVKIVYPAKLLVNGRLAHNALPEWDRYVYKDRLQNLDNISTADSVDPVDATTSDVRTGSALFLSGDESSAGITGNQTNEGDRSRSTESQRSKRSVTYTSSTFAKTTASAKSPDRSRARMCTDNPQTAVKTVYTPPSETAGRRKGGHTSRAVNKNGRRDRSPSPKSHQQRRALSDNPNSRNKRHTNPQTPILRSQVDRVRNVRGKPADVIGDTDTGLDDVTVILDPDGKQ